MVLWNLNLPVFIYPGWLFQFYSFYSFSSFSKEGQFSICVKKEEAADLILSPMTWGIVVNWKKDIKYPFGARIEGIHKNAELTTKEYFLSLKQSYLKFLHNKWNKIRQNCQEVH